jgi:hypothetical protein
MHGDAALSEMVRKAAFPGTTLTGEANLLIMPNVEAANITYNLLKMIGGEGVTVGPFLLGAEKPVHILTPAATVRRIINMTAVASANARAKRTAQEVTVAGSALMWAGFCGACRCKRDAEANFVAWTCRKGGCPRVQPPTSVYMHLRAG